MLYIIFINLFGLTGTINYILGCYFFAFSNLILYFPQIVQFLQRSASHFPPQTTQTPQHRLPLSYAYNRVVPPGVNPHFAPLPSLMSLFFLKGTTWLSAVPSCTAPPTQPQQPHDGTPWPGKMRKKINLKMHFYFKHCSFFSSPHSLTPTHTPFTTSLLLLPLSLWEL